MLEGQHPLEGEILFFFNRLIKSRWKQVVMNCAGVMKSFTYVERTLELGLAVFC